MNTATKSSTSDNTPSDVQMFYCSVTSKIFVDHSKCQIGPAIPMTVNITDVTHWWVKLRCHDHFIIVTSIIVRNVTSQFKTVKVTKPVLTMHTILWNITRKSDSDMQKIQIIEFSLKIGFIWKIQFQLLLFTVSTCVRTLRQRHI